MLPDFLQSSFKAYKEDTNAIATWLASTANHYGYSVDLLTRTDKAVAGPAKKNAKRKGRTPKPAKDAEQRGGTPAGKGNASKGTRYKIAVREFIDLAQYIVSIDKSPVKIPLDFVKALDRAIALRRRHRTWFTGDRSSEEPSDADESHAYFLGVLEHTREILKPRMPTETVDDVLTKSLSEVSIGEGLRNGHLGNMFEGLDVEEPSEAFLKSPGYSPEPKTKAEEPPRYQVETAKSPEEQYLAAHCLFSDLRRIRIFLRVLWAQYKQHDFELVAVSITTNTAIDFVRRMEEDYVEQFPDQADFESMVHTFYGAQCLHRGEDPARKYQPGDLFNFNVYDLADEVLLPSYTILASLQDVISPGKLPIYKKGHFGHRDLRTPWSAKSPRAKFNDDLLAMLEIFQDLFALTLMPPKSVVAEDELVRGIREMKPGRNIPVWLAFAAQSFLDVQHVLGDQVGRGYEELGTAARSIEASIDQNSKFHEGLRIENWPRTNDFMLNDLKRVIEHWVKKDFVGDFIQDKLKGSRIPLPVDEPYRLVKQYPLFCGLLTFQFKCRAHEVGVAFANAWGSVKYAAHLYNAVRQERLLSKVWQDMELLIALQGTENVFVGNYPKTLDEYLKRFMLSMGYSATLFASNRRSGTSIASPKGPRGLQELAKVSHMFTGRYCNNERAVNFSDESIMEVIEEMFDDDIDDESAKPKGKQTKTAASGALLRNKEGVVKHDVPTVDFLKHLVNALHAESMELTMDYFRLHRFSWMLLRSVNEKCKPKLLDMYGPGYLEKENQLPFVVGYIFMAATTTSRVAKHLLPKRTGEVTSKLLATAAEALGDMIGSGAGRMEIEVLEKQYGFAVDLSEVDEVEEVEVHDWREI